MTTSAALRCAVWLPLSILACSSQTSPASGSTGSGPSGVTGTTGAAATSSTTTATTSGVVSTTSGATGTASTTSSSGGSTTGGLSDGGCSPACASGLTCLAGACVPQHCTGSDCPSGFDCQGGFCASTDCTSCAPDQVCVGAACINQNPCGPSETVCMGGAPYCANLNQDSHNCGSCGTTCPGGQACARGACQTSCAGDETACGTLCVDPLNDSANCGGCGQACPAGQICSGGACAADCLSPYTIPCGENQARHCVSPQNDPLNCGTCGTVCGPGTFCSEGLCQALCQGVTDINCGGICVDPQTDEQNCGACGTSCAAGQVCYGATCSASCGSPDTACSLLDAGYCANLLSDPRNCGGCGKPCAPGQVCSDGQCASTCAGASGTLCDGLCVHTSSDNQNCGGCGLTCDAGACDGFGVCNASGCSAGFNFCGQGRAAHCADLQTDLSDCGVCGHACNGSQICLAGVCSANTSLTCDAGCTTGLTCAGGVCLSESCGSSVVCPSGFACLDGGCIEGACVGVTCPTGQACGNGQCYGTSCGTISCDGGLCFNGSCVAADCAGVTCPANQTCAQGQCFPGCAGCNVPDVCIGGACQSGCTIASTSYPAGTLNPNDVCQGCNPAIEPGAWTSTNGGNFCDAGGGDVCSNGTCIFGCSINGQAYSLNEQSAADPCEICSPDTNTLGFSAGNDSAACDGGFCQGGVCLAGCLIGGTTFVSSGALSETNTCQSCQPSESTSTFSSVVDGTHCSTGLCIGGHCQAACDIDGGAIPNGAPETGNACMVCDTSLSTSTWTPVTGPVPDGGTCPRGDTCFSGACTALCNIGGQTYSAGALSDGGTFSCCDPGVSTSTWTASDQSHATYSVAATNFSDTYGAPTSQTLWVGNFDGTNGPDVLVADEADSEISAIYNKGNGTFGPAHHYPAGFQMDHIFAGDVNGDGVLDVLLSAFQGGTAPSVMLGTGGGNLGSPATIAAALNGAITDAGGYNPDYSPEGFDVVPSFFATASSSLPGTIVYYNAGCFGFVDVLQWQSGSNTFAQVQVVADNHEQLCDTNANYFLHGDFNGDGYTDLIIGFDYDFGVYLNSNQASQPLEPQVVYYPDLNAYGENQHYGLVAAPFTGRSYPGGGPILDLVDFEGNGLFFWLNDGNGNFSNTAYVTYPQGFNGVPMGMVAGDFNTDGNLDVLLYSNQASDSQIFFGDGQGNLTAGPFTGNGTLANFGGQLGGIYGADFNGDGILDFAYLATENSVGVDLGACP